MNYFGFSSLLILVTSIIMGLVVLTKGAARRLSILWFFFCLSIASWGAVGYFISRTSSKETAYVLWQIAECGIIFIPVFYFHFVCALVDFKRKKLIPIVYFLYFFFVFFNIFFRRLFIGDLKFIANQFYWVYCREHITLYPIFYITFWVILLSFAFLLLVKAFLKSQGMFRNQLRYFILGSLVGWVGGHGNFLPSFGIDIYPYTNILIALYAFIMVYAMFKYRLMDIRVAITFAGIFLFIYTAVLGVPFYIGYRTKSWILATSVAVVLATVGPMIYRILQRKAANMLLSEQRRYQKILAQAAGGMAREHNLNRLSKLIVYIVKRTVRINFAAIVIDDKEKGQYILKAIRDGSHVVDWSNFSQKHALVKYLRKEKEPILYEELPYSLRESLNFPLRIALIIPSFIEDRLLGFLFLGEKLNRQPYIQDDINAFKILSHQTALAIENCFFFDEFKKAQERIFTAEKLASIGGMADGVAHQVKNRLNHFSIASGEMKFEILDFIKANPKIIEGSPNLKNTLDYLVKISESLVNNVKRTDDIIKGILHFARVEEKETFFSHFSLQESIDLSVDLLKVKHETENVPLTVKSDSSDTIHGVKSQITETIYNLLDNAFEATQEKRSRLEGDEKKSYKPFIELKVIQEPHVSFIELSDNGIGIKEEDKHKIFAPFFTTKSSYKSGTGIGMYVVKRMIEENHNGKVWFNSSYMQGTRIFIELPKRK